VTIGTTGADVVVLDAECTQQLEAVLTIMRGGGDPSERTDEV
jgi:hypothetical protein